MTERKSNFELLRIISIILIIMFHTITQGGVLANSNHPCLTIILNILVIISLVHVNSFVLVTGYFQSKSEFKQSKVWSLFNASYFYRIAIILILIITGYYNPTKIELLKETSIFNITNYWFIRIYLFLYCISPFLNKLISAMDKKTFKKMLTVLFVIVSLIPFFTTTSVFENDGFTLYQFVFLYFIGAYFREYPLEKSYIFKPCSKQMIRLICIVIFFSCVGINFMLTQTAKSLLGINDVIDAVAKNFIEISIYYNNPLVLLQTLAYFFYFSTLEIKSKIINKISSLTLGIYMIHDNEQLKYNFKLYSHLGIGTKPIYSLSHLPYVFIVVIGLFIVCAIIEWLRQVVFKFIYNRKISKKIRDKYYIWLSNLRIFE